ncbi:MAG: hypothetical protein ACI959_000496 [Limisphaerales bacterium]|jgi:hypothetical protein
MSKLRNLLILNALVVLVGFSSCITDEIDPTIEIFTDVGDTIDFDTIPAQINTVLTLISKTTDLQDLGDVNYFQTWGDFTEVQIEYAAPILLTNRHREVFIDLSLPDSLYAVDDVRAFRISAEDAEGNSAELIKYIKIE